MFQPGNSIDMTSGTPTIRPTTTADINSVMAQLTNGNTSGTNVTSNQGAPQQKLVETLSLQDLITDATQTQINDDLNNQEKKDDRHARTEHAGRDANGHANRHHHTAAADHRYRAGADATEFLLPRSIFQSE